MRKHSIQEVYNLFTDCWRLSKEYLFKERMSVEDWDSLENKSGEICERFGNEKLVRKIVLAMLEERERLDKESIS